MLTQLHIENVAIIESMDIDFGNGFNVLTGETGAGKSIIIDSISAVLGERTYRELIRTDAPKAYVSAIFTRLPKPVYAWLEANDLLPDREEQVFLQREIYRDGRNNCKINGRPVTTAILKSLGQQLVNIHGQQDNAQILDKESHVHFLDSFAKAQHVLAEYQALYQQILDLRHQQKSLQMDQAEKARRVDMLSFQINEIEAAGLKPGEDAELAQRKHLLANSAKFSQAIAQCAGLLNGDDYNPGAVSSLKQVRALLAQLADFSPQMAEAAERFTEAEFQIDDIATDISNQLDSQDFTPEQVEAVEARLDVIYKLKQKYGADVEQIIAFAETAQQELDNIVFSDQRGQQIAQQLEQLEQAANGVANRLSKIRRESGERLNQIMCDELRQLDMPRAEFFVQITPVEQLNPTGLDNVEFLFSANAGEPVKPLQKVASGGELARLMLAVKNIFAKIDMVSTLIFDEVDAGISGQAAQKVAYKLNSISKEKQVLSVTHLAAIAAMADVHFKIDKTAQGEKTLTSVTALNPEQRAYELARITVGENPTQTALDNARELIAKAGKLKQ